MGKGFKEAFNESNIHCKLIVRIDSDFLVNNRQDKGLGIFLTCPKDPMSCTQPTSNLA